jgi:Mg/Co/Ni transporter MgtE
MTAEMAIKRIRRTGVDKETIYTCYVNDKNNKLIGITTVKDLLLAEDDTRVEDMMEENVISVHTLDDQEKVAQMFSNYNFLALPVVDNENKIQGILQLDDVREIMFDTSKYDIAHVYTFMKEAPELVFHGESMESVMNKFEYTGAWNLPVVEQDRTYLGFVSKSKIFSAYREQLQQVSHD